MLHPDRSLPLVAINLWYHVGSKNERPGRTGPDDITLYKSVGTSAQDVATAYHVYCAARAEKSGRELPDIITVKDD